MSLANRKLYMRLVFPLAAVIAAFVLISMNSTPDANYFESRMSVTFDSRLDIPMPSEPIAKINSNSSSVDSDFLGTNIDQVVFQFTAPFATEISENGKTITFLARDSNDSTTESFVAAAASRFVAGRPELALFSTPTTTVQLVGVESAGVNIGQSAIGLLLIVVLAIFAAATRPIAMPMRVRASGETAT